MSSLTSLTSTIHDVVFSDKKLSREVITELGLDVEILEHMIDGLKPAMDYVRGYKPLTAFFQKPHPGAPRFIPFANWIEEFTEADQHTHCIEVFRAEMWGGGAAGWMQLIPSEKDRYPGEFDHRYAESSQRWGEQRVYFTRKGKWIVWASYPTSVFRVVDSVAEALQTFQELTPMNVQPYVRSHGYLDSSALVIAKSLSNFFKSSIDAKKNDVTSDQAIWEKITAPLNKFS